MRLRREGAGGRSQKGLCWISTIGIVLICGACDADLPEVTSEKAAAGVSTKFDDVLRIPGDSGTDHATFHRIVGIEPSPDGGHFYVLDRFGPSLRAFDWEGDLVFEAAGQGPGFPGFREPTSLRVIPDRVITEESGDPSVHAFGLDGRYRFTRYSPGHEGPEGVFRRHSDLWSVRHGQLIVAGVTRERLWLSVVDAEDRLVTQVVEVPSGTARYSLRANSAVTGPAIGVPYSGHGAEWVVSGDSVLVVADAYTGLVGWYEIESGGLSLLRQRDLGWTPVPVPITEREARELAADYRGIDPSELNVELPAHVGQLVATSRVAGTGDVWLQRRTWEGARPSSFTEERIIVPFDPGRPVREVALPDNFLLRSVLGDLLLGVHVDETTGEQTVRVYRWGEEG